MCLTIGIFGIFIVSLLQCVYLKSSTSQTVDYTDALKDRQPVDN